MQTSKHSQVQEQEQAHDLFCDFTPQSTTMVMLRRSVNLTALFLCRLPNRLTSTECNPFEVNSRKFFYFTQKFKK